MNDHNNHDEFCWGQFESSIDGNSRLRLNSKIVHQLAEHQIQGLWIYPGLVHSIIIICPETMRGQYIADVQSHLPEDMDSDIAERKYLCTCRNETIDKQGRVYIPSFAVEHAHIIKPSPVVILGTGRWYEVWDFDKWHELSS